MAKILFLASSPAGKKALASGPEFRDIGDALRKAPGREALALVPVFAARRDEIIGRIQEHAPTLIHFSGHGSESGELLFEDEDGSIAPAPVEALADVFRILAPRYGIRCVVLNACYSEKQARAISTYVDCVIGMSRLVSDEGARAFAVQLYSSLAHGSDVHAAFELARRQLDMTRLPESQTPRLLVRDGVDPARVQLVVLRDATWLRRALTRHPSRTFTVLGAIVAGGAALAWYATRSPAALPKVGAYACTVGGKALASCAVDLEAAGHVLRFDGSGHGEGLIHQLRGRLEQTGSCVHAKLVRTWAVDPDPPDVAAAGELDLCARDAEWEGTWVETTRQPFVLSPRLGSRP